MTAYDIYRDGGGSLIASVEGSDASLQRPDGERGHAVQLHGPVARRGGQPSVDSNIAVVTTPSAGVVFQDDFESGSLSMWSTVAGSR